MRKITTDSGLLLVGVDGGGSEFAAAGVEMGAVLHPFADAFDPLVTRGQMTKGLIGQLLQLVRFAIAAGVQIGQNFRGQFGNRHFTDFFRLADMVADVNFRLIDDFQGAGVGS